jgi:hypothetical protein
MIDSVSFPLLTDAHVCISIFFFLSSCPHLPYVALFVFFFSFFFPSYLSLSVLISLSLSLSLSLPIFFPSSPVRSIICFFFSIFFPSYLSLSVLISLFLSLSLSPDAGCPHQYRRRRCLTASRRYRLQPTSPTRSPPSNSIGMLPLSLLRFMIFRVN